jgi:hypothetical protein
MVEMSEPRRRRRRTSRETVGTLKLTYKAGKTGPNLPEGGLVRADEVRLLNIELPKFRIPAQRGESGRPQKQTFTISFYRTREGGAPGLTVIRSVELRLADLASAELVNAFEVEVPNLS